MVRIRDLDIWFFRTLHKLESDPASAQMLARISAARHLRVQYGHRRRKLLVRHMVVADYEIDSMFLCIPYFLYGLIPQRQAQ